jgi:hypothetical protein
MVGLAAWFGWRAFHYAGPIRYAGPVTGCLVPACMLSVAALIMRSCLIVTDEGLIDRRAVRTVRVPWQQIAEFRVERPGGPWGGFCVVAACRDGAQIDLLSMRAYSRAPSSRHLDELHRICWTLEDCLATRGQDLPFVLRTQGSVSPPRPADASAEPVQPAAGRAELGSQEQNGVIFAVLQMHFQAPARALDQGGQLRRGNVVLRPPGSDQVPVADAQVNLGRAGRSYRVAVHQRPSLI